MCPIIARPSTDSPHHPSNPRSGIRYSNIHCVTGKGFCLKKSRKTYFGTMASTSITADEARPQYTCHSDMVWGRAPHECYPKVMTRSSQGHSKVKSAENG